MAQEPERRWKVRGGFRYPANKNQGVYYSAGHVFEATEANVEPYRHMLEEVRDSARPYDADEDERVPEPPVPRPDRRTRPPTYATMLKKPPEDRAMNDEPLPA
jgi:hypothetical protein